MRKNSLIIISLIIFSCYFGIKGISDDKILKEDFYVYSDKNSPLNHFIPSGWMGDYNDLKFSDQSTEESFSGTTSIKIIYTAKKSQGNGWTGIYWQSALNNWGDKKSGFDLSGYNKLVFMAKGKKGGEVINKIKIGGITTNISSGESVAYPDTSDIGIGPIRLTDQWQEYYINLVDQDLAYINGGLSIIFNADQATEEQTIYLDEVRYSFDPELKREKATVNFPFYVYADNSSLDNHFIPSGWMPPSAPRDIKFDPNWKDYPFSGDTCIKLEYKNNSGTRWAGIFWQNPANNWGAIPKAGYNLQGATKLTFWARGEKGNEIVTEFKIGGISSGEYNDSDSSSIGPVQLTKEWKKYEIDLRGRDLSYLIGGFAWSTNIDVNDPEGIVFFLDDIKYEKDEPNLEY